MSKEAMKLALEALEGLEALLLSMGLTHLIVYGDAEKTITALREALAEQPAQQEPVVFYRCNGCGHAYEQVHPTSCDCMEAGGFDRVEYYTSPPAQQEPVLQDIEQYRLQMAGICTAAIGYWKEDDGIHPLYTSPPAKQQDADHEFKNFHRTMCERFGYTHDERDWKRDQVSLIEWIAKKVEQPALEQQEPVAWMHTNAIGYVYFRKNPQDKTLNPVPLYTSPPAQRTWVGLTDKEWLSLGCKSVEEVRIGLAIESALRSKNT